MDPRRGKRVKFERQSVKVNEFDLDQLFRSFVNAKMAEGRARATLDQYNDGFHCFCQYLEEHGVERDVREVAPDLIRDYIRWLLTEKEQWENNRFKTEKKRGLAASSVNTRLKTLRVMFRYLYEEGKVETNPMQKVKNVEEREPVIQVLNVDELQRMLAQPNQRQYAGFRDFVLMNVLIDGFLRINEALSLRVSDVDLDTGVLTIRGDITKNRKTRLVPIRPQTVRLLDELIAENADFDSEYIFLANHGDPLHANHFRHRLTADAKQAKIKVKIHPHLFRHTSATMFLEAGGDISHLQRLLGHADIRMVLRYTHLSAKSLQKQHERFSPINAVRGQLSRPRKGAVYGGED